MTLSKLLSTGHRNAVLRQRESLLLQDAEGMIVSVASGCLWITQEHDTRDIVLQPGMRFEIDRAGLTIVAAEEDSRFRLKAARKTGNSVAGRHAPTSLAHAVVDWLNAWAERPAKRWVPYF